ncbi:MAG: copper resistance protein NlpE N-terminal domain-containing protein [Gammaproteobacteria bacterium]
MNLRSLTALALLGVAIAGCSRDHGDDAVATTPAPATLAGVYAGQFPCSNCTSIGATLWLRGDQRFFFRQSFTGGDGAVSTEMTYALGHWAWDERAAEVVLSGPGPERRLAVLDTDRLRLRVASPVEHVLARDPSDPAFKDRLKLDGESTATKDGVVTFTECVTGLPLRVAEAGAYKELKRQQRVMNPRGKVALTTVEAHLAHVSSGEVLVVDRFMTIKPGKPCPTHTTGS